MAPSLVGALGEGSPLPSLVIKPVQRPREAPSHLRWWPQNNVSCDRKGAVPASPRLSLLQLPKQFMLTQQLPKTRDVRMFVLSDVGRDDAGSVSVSPLGTRSVDLQAAGTLCKPHSYSIGGSAHTAPLTPGPRGDRGAGVCVPLRGLWEVGDLSGVYAVWGWAMLPVLLEKQRAREGASGSHTAQRS